MQRLLLVRRVPALRQYANRTAVAPPKNAKPKKQPVPAAPPVSSSLRARIVTAGRRVALAKTQQTPVEKPKEPTADITPAEELERLEQYRKQVELMKRNGIVPPPILLPLMDHAIPYAAGFTARREYPSLQALYRQFLANRVNDGKNAFAMRHLALGDSFPGITVDPALGWFRGTYLYARHVWGAQSLRPAAWVAPLRQEALTAYIALNTALAHPAPRLAGLAMPPYADELLALAHKRDPRHRYEWTFHREVTPARILSLRAADGDLATEGTATGSRVSVQALVRFDTEQSVEIYDAQGRALHTPASPAVDPARGKTQPARVPAQRTRITEYLVIDKAMYLPDASWRFRARLVPEPGRTVAV